MRPLPVGQDAHLTGYLPLNGHFSKDGLTVEVYIISSDLDPKWSLEVVNNAGTSTVWDTRFDTDEQAFTEFRRTVEEEGMIAFLDDEKASNVLPHPCPH